MKCIACNQEIIENSPFCPYCGEPQPVAESQPVEEPVVESVAIETEQNDVMDDENLIYSDNNQIDNTDIAASQNSTESDPVNNEPETTSAAHETVSDTSYDTTTTDDENLDNEIPQVEDEQDNEEWIQPTDIISNNEDSEEEHLEVAEKESVENKKDSSADISEKKKKLTLFKKDNIETEISRKESIVNKDGYYDDVIPTQKEKFPISKGEFFAKFIFLGIVLIAIALFLIYVIQ